MLLTKQQLLAHLMASDDDTRFVLQHLQVEPGHGPHGSVLATNGHLAVIVTSKDLPSEGDLPEVPNQRGADPDRPVYLHAAAAAAAAKITPKKSDKAGFQLGRLRVEEGAGARASRLSVGASDGITPQLVMTDEPTEMRFPDMRTVFPTEAPVAQILLSAKYLKLVAQYAEKFAAVERPAIRLTFFSPGKPVLFDWSDARHDVRGLLMPMLDASSRRDAVAAAETPEAQAVAAATRLLVPDAAATVPGVTPLVPDMIELGGVDDAMARAALNAREKSNAAKGAQAKKATNSGGSIAPA